METIKKISDLDPHELSIVERLFGQQLDKNTSAILILRDGNTPAHNGDRAAARKDDAATVDGLPDWCDMYAGLSDAEISDLESVILKRADLTRSID